MFTSSLFRSLPKAHVLSIAFTAALALFTPTVLRAQAPAEAAKSAPAAVSADAAKSYSLFVVPKKDSDADAAKLLQKLLRQQLESLAGVTLRPFVGPATPPSTDFLASIEDGFRALNDAVTTKREGKLGAPALVAFGRAAEQLTAAQATGSSVHLRDVARLYKGFAVAHGLNEDGPTAQGFINDSLNLWPKQTPREYGWSVGVANLMSFAMKRRTDNTDTGKVAVTGVEGAAIWIDGKARGFVPSTVERLRPGKHVIRVQADGHRPLTKVVDVAKDETLTVSAALAALPQKAAADVLIGQLAKMRKVKKAAAPLAELAGKVGAQGVIVLQVTTKKGKWALNGWSAVVGTPPKSVAALVARDAEMMGRLETLVVEATGAKVGDKSSSGAGAGASLGEPPKNSLLVAKVVEPKTPDPKAAVGGDGVEETEFYETWWFWTAVGGGVVLITTAAVLAAVLSDSGEEQKFGNINIKLNPL